MVTRASRFLRIASLGILALLLWTNVAVAAPGAAITAVLNETALHSGDQATVAVIVDVNPGLHAQSHKPLDPNLIPLVVKLDANPMAMLSEPIYPAGKMEMFAALGEVSVYTGQIVVLMPVTISSSAPLGKFSISGTVHYQACNDVACFAPQTQHFQIDTEIVAASVAVMANRPDLFKSVAAPPSTAPTTPSAPPPQILGHDLTKTTYPLAFSAAFLVGIIFNLMPCVL